MSDRKSAAPSLGLKNKDKSMFGLKSFSFVIFAFFLVFLLLPIGALLFRSIITESGLGFSNYLQVFGERNFLAAFRNSVAVSLCTAFVTTLLALVLVITVTETRLSKTFKAFIQTGIMVPMLLPTLTYGFAIMYAFGKQGLITRLLGRELFPIYGFGGLLMGYVIYTLPSAFLLIHNAAGYIDRKFIVVSKLMGDHSFRTFLNTLIRPLIGAIGGAFVLTFVLSFTDYGIPAALGGTYSVLSTKLYDIMLGSIPNIDKGAVVAMILLAPAAFGFLLLNYLDRFNFHYERITPLEPLKNRLRDWILGGFSGAILLMLAATLSVLVLVPLVKDYPYNCTFTLDIVRHALSTSNLLRAYENTLMVAGVTALLGTVISYAGALIRSRSSLPLPVKRGMDMFSMLCNTIPGMVIGVSYLLVFNHSSLKGTLTILVICNIVHFFTTPYLMAKNGLSKMASGWETSAALMGDSWFKTLWRIILPNSKSTIIEMLSYYFVNSMVTVSAVIFLVSTHAMVVTAKIKELQYFNKFAEVFVLSLLILLTNLVVKALASLSQNSHGNLLNVMALKGLKIRIHPYTQNKKYLKTKEKEAC